VPQTSALSTSTGPVFLPSNQFQRLWEALEDHEPVKITLKCLRLETNPNIGYR